MATIDRVGDLEINADMSFSRRVWTIQRVGWVIWALILIAALLGLLGNGWLSRGTVADESGQLAVKYERIAHNQAPTRIDVTVTSENASEEELRVWINYDYIEKGTLRMIAPQPEHVELSGERMICVFPNKAPDQAAKIAIDIENEEFGTKSILVGVVDGPQVSFKQYVLP